MSKLSGFFSKLYRFSCRFLDVTGLLLTGLLGISALLFTAYASDMSDQKVLFRTDNLLWTLLGMGVIIFLAWLSYSAALRNLARSIRNLRIVVLIWYVLLGAVLIVFGKSVPAADALSVYRLGEAFADGNWSVMVGPDSYLSYYPHQIGLTTILSFIIRLWRLFPRELPAYHVIKVLQVLLIGVILVHLEKCVQLLWSSQKVHFIYLLLMMGNLPLIMYSSFVYGEILALAATVMGLYCLLYVLSHRGKKPWMSMLVVFFFALSVMTRKNSQILVLAVVILLVLECFHQKRTMMLVLAICVTVAGFGVLPLVQQHYEKKAEYRLAKGVTAMSYFAMGMQESPRANGWYNGYNFNTYAEAQLDPVKANAVSREAIRSRMTYFKENPRDMLAFYWDKYRSQWLDGTYASRQATVATFGGRKDFVTEVYEGKWEKYFVGFCNLWQNFLYVGAFLYFLRRIRHKKDYDLVELLLIICVIGGFLFHGIWEANSRYIFPYGMLLIPYAAKGWTLLPFTKDKTK